MNRAILALLVKRLRQEWPKVRIVFRGDSGFCRHRMLSWCERNDVGYIVGIAKNARLDALSAVLQGEAEQHFKQHAKKYVGSPSSITPPRPGADAGASSPKLNTLKKGSTRASS